MSKVSKSAEELRAIVLAEAINHPVCKADIVTPNQVGYADCAHWIESIVQRLRLEYELKK